MAAAHRGEEAAQNRRSLPQLPPSDGVSACPAPSEGFQPSASFKPRDHEVLTPPALEHLPGCQTHYSGRVHPKMNISILALLLRPHLPSQFLVSNPPRLPCVHPPAAAKSAQTRPLLSALGLCGFQGRVTSLT